VRDIVVFDTNVLFSAVGWTGKPYECIELARAGEITAVTCAELLDELAEKLQSKLGFDARQSLDTVADLLSFVRVVQIAGTLRVIVADPDDDKVLDCAATAGATHIVTGDRRHLLPLGSYNGIPILTASDYLSARTKRD